MNTCTIHPSGALLLEDEKKLTDDSLRGKDRAKSMGGEKSLGPLAPLFENDSDDDNDGDIELDERDKKGKEKEGEEAKRDDENKEKEGEKEGEEDKRDKGKEKLTEEEEEVLAKQQKQRRGDEENEGDDDEDGDEEEDLLKEPVFDEDMWELMDPHSTDGVKAQPFKKGKTTRLPQCLGGPAPKTKGRKKSKGEGEGGATEEGGEDEATTSLFSDAAAVKIRGPYFPEFNYIYTREMKRRLAARRAKTKPKTTRKRKSGK